MRKAEFNVLLFSLGILLFFSCAQVGSPSGGEIDTEIPEIINSIPLNFSTEFEGNEFEIYFDEYVQLKDVAANLLVSPPLNVPPLVSLRGRKIVVSWDDTLKSNTTYSFNFGPSVVDLNEGNAYPELIYVFSTGQYIDSLEFSGNVIDVFSKSRVANTKVMLYENYEDSLPLTTVPNYFGRTNADGNFRISYMKEGDYKIFALVEESSNYLYNGPPEKIAFSDSLISPGIPDSTTTAFQMFLFEEIDTAQFIVESKFYDFGFMQIVLNSPADTLDIKITDRESNLEIDHRSMINQNRDSIQLWLLEPFLGEELELIFKYGKTKVDTLEWYFESEEKFREAATFDISHNFRGGLDQESPVKFKFNAPIITVDSGRIELMEDSVPVNPEFSISGEGDRIFIIDYDFTVGKAYQLFIPDSVFVNIFRLGNDTIQSNFRVKDLDTYGKLIVNLNLPEFEGSFILQLTDDKGTVLKEFIDVNSGETDINLVKPASYGLKLIFDENGKGKWDTGNYGQHIQPERMEVYKEFFQVRANWDLQIDWQINAEFTLPQIDPSPSTPETSP